MELESLKFDKDIDYFVNILTIFQTDNNTNISMQFRTYLMNSEKIAGKSHLGQAVKSSFTMWRPYRNVKEKTISIHKLVKKRRHWQDQIKRQIIIIVEA